MNNKVLEQLKEEYNELLNRAQEIGEIIANCVDIDTHHCGQDAEEETNVSLKELLGMEVVGVGKGRCDGCPAENYGDTCVKVELTGGDYLCLAKPQQDITDGKERPTISFDEEESNPLADIKEKTEDFLNYLDSIFNTKEE